MKLKKVITNKELQDKMQEAINLATKAYKFGIFVISDNSLHISAPSKSDPMAIWFSNPISHK